MAPIPAIYVSHGGGPLPLMGQQPHIQKHLEDVSAQCGQTPKAIVVISAHWEEKVATVLTNPKPQLHFDYYGFPPQTYEYKYDCPGALDVAKRVQDLLSAANIKSSTDAGRGLDHGVFVPLLLSFPAADIPVTQISLLDSLDPAEHIRMGAALRPLRDEGVLLLCSGMSFHNMRAFFGQVPKDQNKLSKDFDDWLNQAMCGPDNVQEDTAGRTRRDNLLINWKSAPGALFSHPREEHLLPLMVCCGAGGSGKARRTLEHKSDDGLHYSSFLIE